MSCLMTATSVPASNSKTLIWLASPIESTWAKKAAAGQVELVVRATRTSVDVAIDDAVLQLKKRIDEERLLDSGLLGAGS